MNIKKELANTARNSIVLREHGSIIGKIGGIPDAPSDFLWADYEKKPLAFLAQFDLEKTAEFDRDNLLPKTGVLSFFYEPESQKQGFDPKDKGCARVYWFEDKSKLRPAEFPENTDERFKIPEIAIAAKSEISYQSYQDFLLQREKLIEDWDAFDDACKSLDIEYKACSKLLGWANPLGENMTKECELVRRGYYLGNDWTAHVTPQDEQEAEQWANRDWQLLLQLESMLGGYTLPLSRPGCLYFYIRKEDLARRDFNNVWLILQYE